MLNMRPIEVVVCGDTQRATSIHCSSPTVSLHMARIDSSNSSSTKRIFEPCATRIIGPAGAFPVIYLNRHDTVRYLSSKILKVILLADIVDFASGLWCHPI